MSFTHNELAVSATSYTPAVIDAALTRTLLKHYRKKHFSSSIAAAEKASVSPSTVAKIENQKRWPKYDPGIGIILKLLDAMGVPFAAFVTDLHELDLAAESAKGDRIKVLKSVERGAQNAGTSEGGLHGRTVSPAGVDLSLLEVTLVHTAANIADSTGRVIAAVDRLTTVLAAHDRQSAAVGAHQPARRQRRRSGG